MEASLRRGSETRPAAARRIAAGDGMQENSIRGSETHFAEDCKMSEDIVGGVAIQHHTGERVVAGDGNETEFNAVGCGEGQEESQVFRLRVARGAG